MPPTLHEPFNPNDGEATGGFPTIPSAMDMESYAQFFLNTSPSVFENWCSVQTRELETRKSSLSSGLVSRKALALPPEMASFARFSLMPETYNGGVIQWPGVPPEALRKVARENLAPQVIINMRVDDVLKYAIRSTHPWKPGWEIKMREGFHVPDTQLSKDIEDAQKFIEHCNNEEMDPRERDKRGYKDFPTFLAELVRDTLIFDGMAVWTDMDLVGRVKAFKALSSYNIRLCLPSGYMGDPNVYAVGVDEAGNVIATFTRDNLVFRHRNSRADVDIYGYGLSEIEQALRLIQAFQNAFDMNADTFTRSATPNGFLVAQGTGMNQKQLDVLSRIWINLKRGVSKQWALPVIPILKDGKIEVIDLHDIKGMDVLYADFINMVGGLFCAMYRFPVRRMGYHISGRAKDNAPPETPTTTAPGIEDHDPYLGVLLQHIEALINPYILWSRWPHLQFNFIAKNPKEDAREYEAKTLACTVDERRALNDQPAMETLGKGEDEKQLLSLMGKAPVDPALSGIYQSLVSTFFAPEPTTAGTPGARMTSKKDPARAQDHGHQSGVRRDSAAESAKANGEIALPNGETTL